MLQISFNITKEDIFALTCYYYDMSFDIRKECKKRRITDTLLLLIIEWLICWDGEKTRPILVIVAFIFAGLFFIFYPRLYYSSIKKAAKRTIDAPAYQKNLGFQTLIFNEECLESISVMTESKCSWDMVDDVYLTNEYLFVFLAGGTQGFPISRKNIPDSIIQEVQKFVESKIKTSD